MDSLALKNAISTQQQVHLLRRELHGLRGLGDAASDYYDSIQPGGSNNASDTSASSGGSSSDASWVSDVDWNNVIKTGGAVTQTALPLLQQLLRGGQPMPQQPQVQQTNYTPLFLLGGAGLLAYVLLK